MLNPIKMRYAETSAKTAANIEETVEVMMSDIIKKGLLEVKKEKVQLADHDKCRKQENDSCCG